MATAVYAFSLIKEYDPEKGFVYYNPGDRIDNKLSSERVRHLLHRGSAATYDRTKSTGEQVADAMAEQDKLQARVKELEAKLAEASMSQGGGESKPHSDERPQQPDPAKAQEATKSQSKPANK